MKRRPRLVIDTNVLVSAFLWQGLPGKLIELAGEQEVQLFSSKVLLEELAATLNKKKLATALAATGLSTDEILRHYRRLVTQVTARQLDKQISRDVDDDVVLGCALAARADFIVTGDADLLVLKSFEVISIVTVAQMVKMISDA
jgi:uncharacterized protein